MSSLHTGIPTKKALPDNLWDEKGNMHVPAIPSEKRRAAPQISVDYLRRPIVHLPAWGALTALDVLLNNLSLGLFLITVCCVGLRPEVFLPAALPAFFAAWFLLTLDLGLLIVDLGDPSRFHHMLRTVRPSSPMWVGVWALALSGLFLTFPAWWSALYVSLAYGLLPDTVAVWFAAVLADRTVEWGCLLATLAGIPCAAIGLLYKGVLFSATSRPIWKKARWFPAYLTNGALLMGAAVLAGMEAATPSGGTALLAPVMLALLIPDILLLELHLRPLLADPRQGIRGTLIHGAAVLDCLACVCLGMALLFAVYPGGIVWLYCGIAGILVSAVIGRWCFVKAKAV